MPGTRICAVNSDVMIKHIMSEIGRKDFTTKAKEGLVN